MAEKVERTEKAGKASAQEAKAVPGAPLTTHGRTFIGTVVSDRMARTVTVVWERRHYVPKYQRYERRYSKIKAHNPDEIDAKVGDMVTVTETRPISKTKHFIVIRKHEPQNGEKGDGQKD